MAYTDGGARGNPGPAGIGAVLLWPRGEGEEELSRYIGEVTNNVAEYRAALEALKAIKARYGKHTASLAVELRMDSELVQKQLCGTYQIKDPTLGTLFLSIHNLRVSSFPHLTVTHIPRSENARADALANRAMDEAPPA